CFLHRFVHGADVLGPQPIEPLAPQVRDDPVVHVAPIGGERRGPQFLACDLHPLGHPLLDGGRIGDDARLELLLERTELEAAFLERGGADGLAYSLATDPSEVYDSDPSAIRFALVDAALASGPSRAH